MPPHGPQAREAGAPRGVAYVSAPSLRQALIALVEDIPGLLSDRVRLLLLELRRARSSLAGIAVAGAAGVVFALTGWLAAWVLVVFLLFRAGVPWEGGLAAVLLINGAGVWIALHRIGVLLEKLALSATVRRLNMAPAPDLRPNARPDAKAPAAPVATKA